MTLVAPKDCKQYIFHTLTVCQEYEIVKDSITSYLCVNFLNALIVK